MSLRPTHALCTRVLPQMDQLALHLLQLTKAPERGPEMAPLYRPHANRDEVKAELMAMRRTHGCAPPSAPE